MGEEAFREACLLAQFSVEHREQQSFVQRDVFVAFLAKTQRDKEEIGEIHACFGVFSGNSLLRVFRDKLAGAREVRAPFPADAERLSILHMLHQAAFDHVDIRQLDTAVVHHLEIPGHVRPAWQGDLVEADPFFQEGGKGVFLLQRLGVRLFAAILARPHKDVVLETLTRRRHRYRCLQTALLLPEERLQEGSRVRSVLKAQITL